MNGRRSAICLGLLCALVLSAVAAQGAAAKGVTAYTCEKVGAGVASTFEDEHCTKAKAGTGQWVHKEIKPGVPTKYEGNNVNTDGSRNPMEFFLALFGTSVNIKCQKEFSTGTLENKEVAKVMQTANTAILFEFSECTVTQPVNSETGKERCQVKEPIQLTANGTAVVAPGEIIQIEYKPEKGTEFGKIQLEDNATTKESCGLLKGKWALEGAFLGKPSGTTNKLTDGSLLEFVGVGGQGLEVNETIRMDKEGGAVQPGIATTITPN
jgi:hypothetical protein